MEDGELAEVYASIAVMESSYFIQNMAFDTTLQKFSEFEVEDCNTANTSSTFDWLVKNSMELRD